MHTCESEILNGDRARFYLVNFNFFKIVHTENLKRVIHDQKAKAFWN